MRFVRLVQHAFDAAVLQREIIDITNDVGAVVSFTGIARSEKASVETLVLDHHPTLTQQSMERIADDCLARFDVRALSIVHRYGRISAGEPIVFAAAAARHRRAAFEAADYVMDRLKSDAVFWKKEEGPAGHRWIEPTQADYDALARWSE